MINTKHRKKDNSSYSVKCYKPKNAVHINATGSYFEVRNAEVLRTCSIGRLGFARLCATDQGPPTSVILKLITKAAPAST